VFVNGQHITPGNAQGKKQESAIGYAEPFSFVVLPHKTKWQTKVERLRRKITITRAEDENK